MSKANRQAKDVATRAKERRRSIVVLAVLVVAIGLGGALHRYLFHRGGATHHHREIFGERVP